MTDAADPRLEALVRRERVLAEFARSALQPRVQIAQLLRSAVAYVCEGLGVEFVKVLKYRPERGDLLVVEGTGWKEGVVGHATLPVGLMSPPGRAWQTGEPSHIADLRQTDEFEFSALLRDHGVVSLLNVPIVAERTNWGVLEADSRTQGFVDEHDAQFLHVFARILGEAIQRCAIDAERERWVTVMARVGADRELMLREMQHRFKNNLSTIQSLLALRARNASPEVGAELHYLSDRVTAIRLAQDQLSYQNNLNTVRMADYVQALCSHLNPGRDDISIAAHTDDADVTIEQAIPLGLIINEAVTNALKHAFQNKGGAIVVTFKATGSSGKLVVKDDGVGKDDLSGGKGMQLIHALAAQAGASIEIASKPSDGTMLTLTFPIRC